MPELTVPLAGSINARGVDTPSISTKDQIFSRVMFDVVENAITGRRSIYANKFPGFTLGSTVSSGSLGLAIEDPFGFGNFTSPCTAWYGATNIEFYIGSTLIGVVAHSSIAWRIDISKAIIGGEETFLIAYGSQAGYYCGVAAYNSTASFTGDTHTNTTIDNVSSVTGLVVGQKLSGTGIVAGTRITVISGTTLTVDTATTATNSTVTISHEKMSKIMSANFPASIIGPFVDLDGYVFISKLGTQQIFQSDLNNLQTWGAANYLTASQTNGSLLGLSRKRNFVVAHCADGLQFLYNAGNATGSVLSVSQGLTTHLGGANTFPGVDRRSPPFCTIDDFTFIHHGGIWAMGDGFQKISTDAVDRVLENISPDSLHMSAFSLRGKSYLLVQSTTISVLYDIGNRMWTFSGFSNMPLISRNLGMAVHRNATGGALHYMPWSGFQGSAVYQDDGNAYSMSIQTEGIDHGTSKRKFIQRVTLDADIQASGTATLEASDDDFTTFVTLGAFDLTKQDKFIARCGSYMGSRSYRLTHSANTPFRAKALRIEYTL